MEATQGQHLSKLACPLSDHHPTVSGFEITKESIEAIGDGGGIGAIQCLC